MKNIVHAYSRADLARLSRLSEAALTTFDRTGLLSPSLSRACGPGRPARYSSTDAERAGLLGACWHAGCPSSALAAALGLLLGAGDAGRLAVVPCGPLTLLRPGEDVPARAAVVEVFAVRARVADELRAIEDARTADHGANVSGAAEPPAAP